MVNSEIEREGKTMKIINVPTGKIVTSEFSRGPLEFLSIGDYGQAANIKADFLGLDQPVNGVENGSVMPLSEKWVITISTQYGCSMKCRFCDVPLVGPGKNVSEADILGQILLARELHGEVTHTKRLNLHFARMGEPTFNTAVLDASRYLARKADEFLDLQCDTFHPVLTTMMPKKNGILKGYVQEWVAIKNEDFGGEANIQVSINSTSDDQRDHMYRGSTRTLAEISGIVSGFPAPVGRKYCLNMAMADGYEFDGAKLAGLFNPDHWMVKITPIHVTTSTEANGMKSSGGYDLYDFYAPREDAFKEAGFDTLVFVPSYDEDFGMITCGNAVLSGRMPTIPYTVSHDE